MEGIKEKETEALKRGRAFRENCNIDITKPKNDNKISSGFWLSNDQLIKLAGDLAAQGSHGIGFMVGRRSQKSNNRKKIYSVEIVPLINTNKESNIESEVIRKVDSYFEEVSFKLNDKVKIHLNGCIKTDLKILHTDINSNEGQRFPPPEL